MTEYQKGGLVLVFILCFIADSLVQNYMINEKCICEMEVVLVVLPRNS